MKAVVALLAACLAFGIFTRQTGQPVNESKPTTRVEKVRTSFGDQIRIARIKKGLTKQALASQVGISLSLLEQAERGQLVFNTEVSKSIETVLEIRLDSTAR